MRTKSTPNERSLLGKLLSVLLGLTAAGALLIAPGSARGQIFVSNFGNGTVGEYTLSGAPINASFITGLNSPSSIAVSGNDLFVSNYLNGTIGRYTSSGATVNTSLVTGLDHPAFIALSGGNLFVVSPGMQGGNDTGVVGLYTTSGATLNASLRIVLPSSTRGIWRACICRELR